MTAPTYRLERARLLLDRIDGFMLHQGEGKAWGISEVEDLQAVSDLRDLVDDELAARRRKVAGHARAKLPR